MTRVEHVGVARLCSRCGRVNSPEAQFCGTCGGQFVPELSRAAACPPASVLADERYVAALSQARELATMGPNLFAMARRAYLLAARLEPTELDPLLELARLARRFGRKDLARRYYRVVVRRRPDCDAAWIEGAECCGEFQTWRRAWWLAHAVRAVRDAGRTPDDGVMRMFLSHYGRLRGWERRLIRMVTGQPEKTGKGGI